MWKNECVKDRERVHAMEAAGNSDGGGGEQRARVLQEGRKGSSAGSVTDSRAKPRRGGFPHPRSSRQATERGPVGAFGLCGYGICQSSLLDMSAHKLGDLHKRSKRYHNTRENDTAPPITAGIAVRAIETPLFEG
jgi:hypothetical protein